MSLTTPLEIRVLEEGAATVMPDEVATEEPLEIRLATPAGVQPIAVTLRTPGADAELAAGFLYGEGVVSRREDLAGVVADPEHGRVTAALRPGLEPDLAPLERHFHTTSACGLCGRASLDAVLLRRDPRLAGGPRLAPSVLYELPARLRAAQGAFRATGGLHAAGLFNAAGELLAAREDVGRHNALDKLLGRAFLDGRLPFGEPHVVVVSGRASYELVQKCLMAEVPVLAAVSAPSSLAVALARRFGMTLVGFLRERRCNVYSGPQRLGLSAA